MKVGNQKGKLNIFLADLTHTGTRIATENIPLNIGLLASYAKNKFVKDIEVKLFKYPEKLLSALKEERCDILGCSSYIWNNNLSEWAFEAARQYNPMVLTVRGGWNFPLEQSQQAAYLKKHAFTDIFCIGEGEEAFAQIIHRLLGLDMQNLWNRKPLAGSVFLREGEFIEGERLPRIQELDIIPSPYSSGLLDEFFDGQLTPIIETNRGCPFQCNYCNNSNVYYNKVNFFSTEYVKDEIRYIAKKVSSKDIRNLYISDTNFGMYPRDKELSTAIRQMQDKYHWPLGIMVSTGKNNVKKIIENTEVLGNSLVISMSVQSMNPDTLKAIKRDNIKLNMFEEISKEMKKRGMSQMAEFIVPLPEETYESYLSGLKKLLEFGAQAIVSYTLQLNNGTIYKNEEYRKEYDYHGKFRLIPYDFGIYGGKKVFDYEEVGATNKTINFQEYVKIRKLALIIELLLSNFIFYELLKLLNENKIDTFSFLVRVLEGLEGAPEAVGSVFDSFARETTFELKDSPEELTKFYGKEDNYEKLKNGKFGGNVIYKHKAMMLSQSLDAWVEYIFNCCLVMLDLNDSANSKLFKAALDIKSYILAKLNKMFDSEKCPNDMVLSFNWDVHSWSRNNGGIAILSYSSDRKPLKYRFYFNDEQRLERNDIFNRYGSDLLGLTKIMAKVTTLERLFRKIEEIK